MIALDVPGEQMTTASYAIYVLSARSEQGGSTVLKSWLEAHA